MFLTKINYFLFLFIVIIYPNKIVVGVDLITPRQIECNAAILELFQIDGNPEQRKMLYQSAILHLRYKGENPTEIGKYSKNLYKYPIGPTAPYHLYNQLSNQIVDNPFGVHYYDKIARAFDADDISTPYDFCDNKDPNNILGMKSVCLYEIFQIGFKEKVSDNPVLEFLLTDKKKIVEHAFANLILDDFYNENLQLEDDNSPENHLQYDKEYFLDIVDNVKAKRAMLWPDQFCHDYAI